VCAIALVLGVVAARPAWAGRPLATEDTGTLDPGQVEAEISVDYVRDGRSGVFSLPGGPALNVGVLPRLEGSVATGLVVLTSGDGPSRVGPGDTLIRLKYRIVDETPAVPALMGAIGARLPTGDADRGLGEPDVDVQTLLVASKSFGAVTTTVNGGYTFVTRDGALDVVNVNAAAEARITDVWSVVGEVVSELAVHRRGDSRVLVRGGVVYALGEWARLDAAAAVGRTRGSPDLVLTVGITVLLHP
jgi:hypothetical protein